MGKRCPHCRPMVAAFLLRSPRQLASPSVVEGASRRPTPSKHPCRVARLTASIHGFDFVHVLNYTRGVVRVLAYGCTGHRATIEHVTQTLNGTMKALAAAATDYVSGRATRSCGFLPLKHCRRFGFVRRLSCEIDGSRKAREVDSQSSMGSRIERARRVPRWTYGHETAMPEAVAIKRSARRVGHLVPPLIP